jgi:hypothetical protein
MGGYRLLYAWVGGWGIVMNVRAAEAIATRNSLVVGLKGWRWGARSQEPGGVFGGPAITKVAASITSLKHPCPVRTPWASRQSLATCPAPIPLALCASAPFPLCRLSHLTHRRRWLAWLPPRSRWSPVSTAHTPALLPQHSTTRPLSRCHHVLEAHQECVALCSARCPIVHSDPCHRAQGDASGAARQHV